MGRAAAAAAADRRWSGSDRRPTRVRAARRPAFSYDDNLHVPGDATGGGRAAEAGDGGAAGAGDDEDEDARMRTNVFL